MARSRRGAWKAFSKPGTPALAALSPLEQLEIDGTLSGAVPVVLAGRSVRIESARLATETPGSLRWRPDDAPSALSASDTPASLVVRALEHFRYQKLGVTLDGQLGGDLMLELNLTGANPDLYGGHPVELNLTLTGALDTIVRRSLTGWQVPDRIRERISRFGEEPQ